jgi:hypothetical protein
MKHRYAEFSANFPDDHEEDERDIVVFGGRLAAEAIAEMLRASGYEVSRPEHMHEHGWDFEVRIGGKRVWFELVRLTDDYILQTEAMIGWFAGLFGPVDFTFYAELLAQLNEGLAKDPRFGPIEWYALSSNHKRIGEPLAEPPSVI